MHERYEQSITSELWSDQAKLSGWQKVELAVIRAQAWLGNMPEEAYLKIKELLEKNPIDIEWWKERDKEINHDLNAFLDERLRFIPKDLHQYFHKKITSYDTEESAFIRTILESIDILQAELGKFKEVLVAGAKKYRYVIMNERTHGQEAEMMSFGKRYLSWIADIETDYKFLCLALDMLKYSKISGAIGNYGSIDPEVEKLVLGYLGFKPFYGATQIMPREIFVPVATSICQIVQTLNKIAMTIRLGARSGRPLFHEPFAKQQKGSSAMPHKKNTIATEQIEGMARMAKSYLDMIIGNIATWEGRDISQSCVERVAWPDLFHVAIHSIRRMTKVISGLVVYPDNMLLEIIDSKGCYASSEAKEFLKEKGTEYGISHEDAYRIVQLAAFNAFAPSKWQMKIRENLPESLDEAGKILALSLDADRIPERDSIREIIYEGVLFPMPSQLGAGEEEVARWNRILVEIFSDYDNLSEFRKRFEPMYLLRNEEILYREILG